MPTLWLCVTAVTVTAIVVGAAFGGGLGSALRRSQRRARECCASSSYTTTTVISSASDTAATTTGGMYVNHTPAAPTTIASVALDCPDLDGRSQDVVLFDQTQTFTVSCIETLDQGDIGCVVAYSLSDCLAACGSLNYWSKNATACTALDFKTGLAAGFAYDHGDCWLKQWQNAVPGTQNGTGDATARLSQ